MAKVLRLRKQELLLEDRAKEMIRRGMFTLDELDAAEAVEKEEQSRQELVIQNLAEASDLLSDPILDPEGFQDLPVSF
jgi:hypothetical protein